MVDCTPRGKSRASLFQSRVLIEELEARQFLTVAPTGHIGAAVRADQAVTKEQKAIQATSPVSVQPPAESAREEVEDSAPPTSNAASKTSAVNPDRSKTVASASNNLRAAASPSAAEDDSTSVVASEGSSDDEAKGRDSGSPGDDDAVSAHASPASPIKASSVTAESQSNAPASSSAAETVRSPQDAIGEAANSAEQSVASISAEHDGVSARAPFNSSLVSARWMDLDNLRTTGAGSLIGDSAAIGQAIQAGKGLVLETGIFSSKTILNQLSALPGALANLGVEGNGGADALAAGPLKTAVAPFFYIPRINWIGAVSDAWESFTRESLVLPLADSGRVKAWVVTAVVGAADAVLAGYWIRSRNRRKRTFYSGSVAGSAVGLLD